MSADKRIFFHTGLERTATTFLQKNVFPKIQGLTYVPKKRFFHFLESNSDYPPGKYLVTHEFNMGYKEMITAFSQNVQGDVYPLLMLRKPSAWLYSQYKRLLKIGETSTISSFFDPENLKSSDLNHDALNYLEKIHHLEDTFGNKPKVIIYDQLKEKPQDLVTEIADWMGADLDANEIDFSPRHVSYSEKQLKFFLWICQNIENDFIKDKKWFRYPMLHLARLVPERFYEHVEWPTSNYFLTIDEMYREDWKRCLEYAQKKQ